MGFIMDKTKSKHGKARPWMLWLAIPFGLFTMLMMLVPAGWSDVGKYVYIFISYNITTTFLYTAINIPYGALNSLMTRDQAERQSINIFRMVMAQFGSLIISGLTLPLVNAVGGSTNQRSWVIVAAIYGAMAAGLFLLCFYKTKERVDLVPEADRKIGFGKTLKLLFKNDNWLLLCAVWVLFALGMGMGMGVGTYYCKYILGDENVFGYFAVVQTGVGIIGMMAMGPLVKKYGKRNVAMVGSIISVVGHALMLVAPLSIPYLMAISAVKGLGTAALAGTLFAMVADTIEYGQWKTGVRLEGPLYSTTTFGAKVGAGIGLVIATSILSAAGYDGTLATQSASALKAVSGIFLLAPLPFMALVPVVYWRYKLDKQYPQVMRDLAEREVRA